jgi:hypothetical protein
MRRKNSEQAPKQIANLRFGDCILFRLSDMLQHRVTPVTGDFPKIAFAGWFKSQPDYLTDVLQLAGCER